MDKLKTYGSNASSNFKNEAQNLQGKAQNLSSSANQAYTNQSQNLRNQANQYNDKYGSNVQDIAQNVYDDDSFGDYDALDKLTASNKVPVIQGMPTKGGQIYNTAVSKGQDLANKASNAGNYLNDKASQQAKKVQKVFQPEPGMRMVVTRAGVLEDDRDSDRERDQQAKSQMGVSKSGAVNKKNYQNQYFRAGNLEDDHSEEVKSANRVPTQSSRAGALEDDFEENENQQYNIKLYKHRAGNLEDDHEDVSLRAYKYKASSLMDDRDDDRITKSSIRTYKYRASNLIDDYEDRSPSQHSPVHDRTHERAHERELEELRRTNQRLQDDLNREMQKSRELSHRLQHTPTQHISTPTESPKKSAPPRRPLGSPKAEMFNKQSVRSPTGKSGPGSPVKPYESAGPQVSLGELIRRNIEEEEALSYPPNSASRFFPSNTNTSNLGNLSNVNTSMEFFSPVKNQRANRDHPYSPAATSVGTKQFKDHDSLPVATNAGSFQLACLKDNEILFEDDALVIESRTSYVEGTRNSDPLVKVTFTYTNKTASELKDFSVTYKSIHNVVLSAESTDVVQRLGPRETQTHKLNAVLVGPLSGFGFMVAEYRVNDEAHQRKIHSPIVLSKFAKFTPISSADFNREKKILQSQYPDNYEESPKIRLSQKNVRDIKDNLLSKMTLLETDDDRSGRFSVYGGLVKLGDIPSEALVRFIIENETQLLMIQLSYEDELLEYAKDLVRLFAFECNEKAMV